MFPISATRIKAFECPYYFKKKYLEGEKDEDGPLTPLPFLVGKFVHQVIFRYDAELRARRLEMDAELFYEILHDEWGKNLYIPQDAYDIIEKDILLSFVERHVLDLDSIYGLELELAFNEGLGAVDWQAEDVWLRAKIDRVNIYPAQMAVMITDYKTNPRIPTEAQMRRDWQAKIYPFAMALHMSHNNMDQHIDKYIIVFHYIRYNHKIIIELDKDEVMDAESRLRMFSKTIDDRVASGLWHAQLSGNCPICRYECPLENKDLTIIRTHDDAVAAAIQMELDKKRVSGLKEQLKAYAESTGLPIDTGKGVFQYEPVVKYKNFKASEVIKTCNELNIPIDKVLDVTAAKIRKLKDEENIKRLLSLGKKSVVSEFTYKPHGDEDEEN